MKKLIILFVLILFFKSNILFSKTNNSIKMGTCFSQFRHEKGKTKPGLCFGIGKEFYPLRSFNGFIGFGLNYQQKKYILTNRNWPANFDPNDSDIITGDINVNISYIDIPLKLGYSIIINHSFALNIYTGYSLSLPIKNYTKSSNRKTIPLGPDERGKYNFDYVQLDENYTIPSTNFHIGARLSYKRCAIVLNYTRALSITEGITNLNIQDKIDTFEISMVFIF